MWPGQQPPGGEQNPQDPNQNPQQPNPYQQPGYQQQPNPYQQPGYPQPNPYQQQPGTPGGPPQQGWGAPTAPGGPGVPPPGPGGGGGSTKIVAIVCALAVVVAAGVTGFLVLGKDDKKDVADDKPSPTASAKSPSPSASPSSDTDRQGGGEEPTIPGWQAVVNARFGTVFDVPADWEVVKSDTSVGYEWKDKTKPDGYDRVTVNRPAYFKSKWCTSDPDKDGKTEDSSLGLVGTRGEDGATSTDNAAETRVPWWVFGGYTEPDKKSVKQDDPKPYTTKSGLVGSTATAHSENTPHKGKCASDGKAITFAFKNGAGDYVSWDLSGAKGVKGEIPEETIQRILSTVRLTKSQPTS